MKYQFFIPTLDFFIKQSMSLTPTFADRTAVKSATAGLHYEIFKCTVQLKS